MIEKKNSRKRKREEKKTANSSILKNHTAEHSAAYCKKMREDSKKPLNSRVEKKKRLNE